MRSERTKNKTQKNCHQNSEGETEEGNTSITDCDQNSEVSSMEDTDEDIDTAGTEEEDWVENIKRSRRQAEEKMRTAIILCWIESQRKMKWRFAMRIASHPETRWTNKKQQNGAEASAMETKQTEQWEDRERDGKTTSI